MPAKTPSSRKAVENETSIELRASFDASLRWAWQKAQLTQTHVETWSISPCSGCWWHYFDAVAPSVARVV
jgi:hypothetical protein